MEGSILKLSNGSYVLYGKGIPDITRSCFIAEKGNSWISIDYSG